MSTSSVMASSNNHRRHPRLSPVSENKPREPKITESYFIISPSTQSSDSRTHDPTPKHILPSALRPDPSAPDITFPRRKVPPIKPVKSALTAMLASTSSSSNPFTEFYAAISGRAETESTSVSVFFPRAKQPSGQVMELNVRKDASVEEVLGYALWNYWEDGWLPKLDEGLKGEDDPRWATVLSAVGWVLRIAEEDGEVDEDFPREPVPSLPIYTSDNSLQHPIVQVEYPSSTLMRTPFWKLRLPNVRLFTVYPMCTHVFFQRNKIIYWSPRSNDDHLESWVGRRKPKVVSSQQEQPHWSGPAAHFPSGCRQGSVSSTLARSEIPGLNCS